MKLKNKIAVITGSAGGIGLATGFESSPQKALKLSLGYQF